MKKPKIFFSHSSIDKDVLLKLKELFIKKTGGTIDVFLSSDGQSIPFGKNWVHRVEEALEEASLMVVFLTPSSLKSNWIYFESGFVYSRKIKVVPVGFLGVDLSLIPPPLNLLQGFNISNHDGLDNLIAVVNEEYSHSHKLDFTNDEYQKLIASGDPSLLNPLAKYVQFVDTIILTINRNDDYNCDTKIAFKLIKEILSESTIEFRDTKKGIEVFGMLISTEERITPQPIYFNIDPSLVNKTIPLVILSLVRLRSKGVQGVSFVFGLNYRVESIRESHKITARLFGSDVTFGDKNSLIFDDIDFRIESRLNIHGADELKMRRSTYLHITPLTNEINVTRITALLDLLFKKNILYISDKS